jgi:hypothetical protein
MTFLFDNLPLQDIIYETIIPMLDYESIIQFNRCLSPPDRYRAKFTKTEILSHEFFVACDLLKKRLDEFVNITGITQEECANKKSQLLIKILQEFDSGKHGLILMYNPGFHKNLIIKLNSLFSPQTEDLFGVADYLKEKLNNLSKHLLPKILQITPKTTVVRLQKIPSKGITVFPTFSL